MVYSAIKQSPDDISPQGYARYPQTATSPISSSISQEQLAAARKVIESEIARSTAQHCPVVEVRRN